MSAKILWVSRHASLLVQRAALQAVFGADCEVVHRDIGNAGAVAAEYRRGGYTDLVCVVPMATLDHICREGLNPLWAEMVETPTSDGRAPDLAFGAKKFWFTGFKRVKGVGLELAPVEPLNPPWTTLVRVLRITRHSMADGEWEQVSADLKSEVEIIEDCRPVRDCADAIARMRQKNADEILIVAPYGVYDQIVKAGVWPLYARVERGRFISLHRITGVRLELEDL